MPERVYNFNPGPATLPLEVLKRAQGELLNYKGTGMSVMEISHRSKEFEEIIHQAEALFLELAGLKDGYRVLFLQGGASLQFAMVPLNYLSPGKTANYVVTGSFAKKALAEAKKVGQTHVAASSEEDNFRSIPKEYNFSPDAAYVHVTTNNTIFGTQWQWLPECGDIPLVADMSSDIFSRPLDFSRFSLVYAGAQKNLGPAGVTVVLIKKELAEKANQDLPVILRYDTYANNDSLYNTPPTFSVYMVRLVLEWIKEQGGLAAMERHNREKAACIYDAIDQSGGFYRGHAEKEYRSLMNVTFRLPSEELEKKFVQEAAAAGLVGLKGHRSVGGMRASIYNAMSREGCEALADFMNRFRRLRG